MAAEESFADWIGRVTEAEDSVPEQTARALAATLDLGPQERGAAGVAPDGPLPPLWHWLAFLPDAPTGALARSGQAHDPLLPPSSGARVRLTARLRFHGELRIGETIHRRSEILAVAPEGEGVRITVAQEFSTARNLCVSEVTEYFLGTPPSTVVAPPATEAWRAPLALDPVRLFRFSAATFDAERLHYDQGRAAALGLPGLAAQDRLLAILLVEAARGRRGGAWPAAVALRVVRPLFLGEPAAMVATPAANGRQALAAVDGRGVCLSAEIAWEA